MSNNPRLLRAARGIERRMFLTAMATGLSLPVAARLARVATAASTSAPKRFFLFYIPHGAPPEHYAPRVSATDNTDFALNQSNVSILGPLEMYKRYVNVYQGFQYRGSADTHTGVVNCLSGVETIDANTSRTTVEHVIAKAIGAKPLILGACSHLPFGLDMNGKLFWDGTPVDPQKSPVKAADTLFGGLGGPPQPVSIDVQLRKDLLALTAADIQELQKTLTGLTRERTKLQTHLQAIQSLQAESGMGVGPSSCSSKPLLPTVEMVRAASAGQIIDPSGGNDYFYQADNFPLLLKAQMEVVTQAIICNAAQVIGLMPMWATCDFDFKFMGVPGSHHNTLSHRGGEPAAGVQYNSPVSADNFTPGPRTPFATAQRWFIQQLVDNVVSVLANTDDPAAPGTKVLDNTLIYLMSEIGDGAGHQRTSEIEYPQVPEHLPLVTIGKCAGAIKSGQVVQFPIDKQGSSAAVNRPATDLYLSLARAMGAPTATFPGTTGPVTEVLT